MAMGGACELTWRFLRLKGEPPMTRFVASQLATSHWFNLGRAKADLGYQPEWSFVQGLKALELAQGA
jgi:nucleoside-diphosphate-sugar epimerase